MIVFPRWQFIRIILNITFTMGDATQNLCAVLNGPKNLEIQDRPLSDTPLGEDEVLIEVVSTGICGSDAHSWEVGQANPIILGHESTGIIVKIGSGVADRKIGERVAIEPRQSCMRYRLASRCLVFHND